MVSEILEPIIWETSKFSQYSMSNLEGFYLLIIALSIGGRVLYWSADFGIFDWSIHVEISSGFIMSINQKQFLGLN